MKKYGLVKEDTVEHCGRILYRIKALRKITLKFGVEVDVGTLGGYIEKEQNLSHDGNAWVYGDAEVYGNAKVYGNAWVYGDAEVCGNAEVCGDAKVYGDAKVCGDAHYLTIGPIGSRNDFTTFFRNKEKGISVRCGCFCGTVDKFLQAVEETHGDNKHAASYRLAVELAKAQIELEEEQ